MDFNVADSVRRDIKVLMTKTRYTVIIRDNVNTSDKLPPDKPTVCHIKVDQYHFLILSILSIGLKILPILILIPISMYIGIW